MHCIRKNYGHQKVSNQQEKQCLGSVAESEEASMSLMPCLKLGMAEICFSSGLTLDTALFDYDFLETFNI